MPPVAARLPGDRLHLQHGPIDLVIGADGPGREAAFSAAARRFAPLLDELVAELPLLRSPAGGVRPVGPVAIRMADAVQTHCRRHFVTPMAAVAGAAAVVGKSHQYPVSMSPEAHLHFPARGRIFPCVAQQVLHHGLKSGLIARHPDALLNGVYPFQVRRMTGGPCEKRVLKQVRQVNRFNAKRGIFVFNPRGLQGVFHQFGEPVGIFKRHVRHFMHAGFIQFV